MNTHEHETMELELYLYERYFRFLIFHFSMRPIELLVHRMAPVALLLLTMLSTCCSYNTEPVHTFIPTKMRTFFSG